MKKLDLGILKEHLSEYAEMITQKRQYGKYNCPLCGSGTGQNGTPAFSLYQDEKKAHCFSCGFDGTIIDLYLSYHQMAKTRENAAHAINALADLFHLTTQIQPFTNLTERKIRKTEKREHIYQNESGSVFGKKVIKKFDDGSKTAQWVLFNPEKNTFNKYYGLSGQKAPLYNAHLLYANQTEPVYIVEGEKDADTLTSWGLTATTFPNGASFTQWQIAYTQSLQGHDLIIITDNDSSGQKYGNTIAKHALRIANSIKIIPSCEIWNKCPEKGDITDISEALGKEETQKLLNAAIQKTPFFQANLLPEEHVSASDKEPAKIKYATIKASEVETEKQEFLWNPYIPIGEITVMFAAGGTGKSFAAIGIAADVTAGRSLPQYQTEPSAVSPEKVLIISAEDQESTIKQRLDQINGNPENCILLKTPKNRNELQTDNFLLPQDKNDTAHIEAFTALLEEHSPKLVIIDPWSVYIGSDKNMNKQNDIRGITTVLTTLAKEYHCAILIIAHVNKMPQVENANNAVSGSTALIDAARSALCVRSLNAESDQRVIIHTKANYSRKGQSVCYQIIDQGENETARFEWNGFCSLTADDLTMSARSGKKLTDIAFEKEDETENTVIIANVITKLSEPNKKIPISYNRLRIEIIESYGIDLLGTHPKKKLYKTLSELRARGIGLEFPAGGVRGLTKDNTHEPISRGILICRLTDGSLMASAMPK